MAKKSKKSAPRKTTYNGGTLIAPGPGRKPLTEVERAARESSRREIAEVWGEIKALDVPQLHEYMQQPGIPAIRVMMASAVMHGIRKGDLTEVHRFYDRLLGKPKQTVETISEEPAMFIIPGMADG